MRELTFFALVVCISWLNLPACEKLPLSPPLILVSIPHCQAVNEHPRHCMGAEVPALFKSHLCFPTISARGMPISGPHNVAKTRATRKLRTEGLRSMDIVGETTSEDHFFFYWIEAEIRQTTTGVL